MEKLINLSTLGIGERNPNAFNDPERAYGWNDLLRILEAAHTVDAVEVVRCRDCKFGMHFGDPEDEWINCKNLHGNPLMPFDGFCSYGKRNEGDGHGNCLVHPGADLRGDPDGGGIVHHCQR